MKRQLAIITVIAVFSLLWASSEAFSYADQWSVPSWMEPFADPQPVYKFDWAFGTGNVQQDINGTWYNTSLNAHVGQSRGDGTAYTYSENCYWTSISGQTNGFSLSNDIGEWIDAVGTGRAVIRYTIRQDYSGLVDNSDIVQIGDDEVEAIIKHGYNRPLQDDGIYDTLGMRIDGLNDITDRWEYYDITALEWNPDFDDENLAFEHYFAVQGSGGTYNPCTFVARNQDDESVYMTFGARAQLESGSLYQVYRTNKIWDGTGNGWTSADGWDLWTYVEGRSENLSTTYNGLTTFDGTNWYLPIYIDSVEYMQRLDLAYDGGNFPASSGAVIQWYDDYDLYLSGDIANPGGYGVSGRYILERNTLLQAGSQTTWAHAADVCYEARTYNPGRNPDGPESPYEWVYDASGDMYVPTLGGDLPGDTAAERAYKLIGNHPAFPDDDVWGECEESDRDIWKNQDANYGASGGAVGRSLFVESWKLAGLMLGLEFWDDDEDYFWSGEMGAVCERTWADEFMNFGPVGRLPLWTWNSTTSQWDLPPTFDIYGNPPSHDHAQVWGWAQDYTDNPVAGYDALNMFMRYVFDIDALVVEDVDDDGEFDVGEDYVLFSVVDDGLYSKYAAWGATTGTLNMYLDGQYFDGDTIFLYDGTSVTTYFDAEAGIFFGQSISTATAGLAQTFWAMGPGFMDLDALDIGILPEPSTLLLLAPALVSFAALLRKKFRSSVEP